LTQSLAFFFNNSAAGIWGRGGAISNYSGTITTISGTFTNNTAKDGGAIYNVENSAITTIQGTFTKNSAEDRGGAIANIVSKISTITNSVFDGNTGGEGGAIHNARSIDYIIFSSFTGNTAELDGGAIYNTGEIAAIAADFTSNTAGGDGGAIYNTATLTLSGGNFTNNSATRGLGGAIYNTGTLTLNPLTGDMVFAGNTDSNGTVALYNAGSVEITASDSNKVIFNDAIRSEDETKAINLQSGTVVLNNTLYGGKLTVNSGATLKLGSYTANGTTAYGGFDRSSTTYLVVDGTLDTENGRIETNTLHDLSLNSASLVVDMDLNNRSGGEYQADLLHADRFNDGTNSLSLSGVNLLSGMPTASSGFVRLLAGPNLASVWGTFTTIGDYYVLSTEGMLTLTKSSTAGAMDFTWDNAKAYFLPDAVSATSKTSVQYNLTADEVVAKKLSKQEPTNLVIKGDGKSTVTARNNVSGITTSNGYCLTITDVKDFTGFSNNYSGGVLENNGALTVSNTGFSNNTCTDHTGGAIYNGTTGTAKLTVVTFTGNRAKKMGGAVANFGTISTLSGTANDNSSSDGNGGAVYNSGTIESLSGIYTNNSATNGYGGAIFNEGKLTITADGTDTVFTGNKDQTGSNALYNNNGGTANLVANNGGNIVFNDAISGAGSGTINLCYGTLQLNNALSNNNLVLDSGAPHCCWAPIRKRIPQA